MRLKLFDAKKTYDLIRLEVKREIRLAKRALNRRRQEFLYRNTAATYQ